MTKADREWKSTEATLAGIKKQTEDQRQQLYKKVEALKKAKQSGYDTGVKETEDALKAQVIGVCRGYYLQVWTEALNLAWVEASSDMRKLENIFYPPALWIVAPPTSQATTTPKALTTTQFAPKAPTTIQPTTEASTIAQSTAEASAVTQPAGVGTTKATSELTKASKEKEVSQRKEAEHSEPPLTTKIDPPPSTSS